MQPARRRIAGSIWSGRTSPKLLHADVAPGDTRVQLLRLDPGTVIPRHRHAGEVHALTLAGTRELLDTGELVGPGGYVYEPPGNVDSWRAVGTTPLYVFVTVRGAIEYLADDGTVLSRSTTASIRETWGRFIAERGPRG